MRLSVILPAVASQSSVEATLVSLLTHRTHDSEVVLVCDRDFKDTYGIEDEVRFLRADRAVTYASACNEALAASLADNLAIVMPGVEVSAGWSRALVSHLNVDAELASATGLVEAACGRQFAGLRFTQFGRRVLADAAAAADITGPARWLGIYRRNALMSVGGWNSKVDDRVVDLDLALRLRAAGWSAMCDPSVRAALGQPFESAPRGFRVARDLERLFRATRPGLAASVGHAADVFAGRLMALTNPAATGELIGRVLGRMIPLPVTPPIHQVLESVRRAA